MANHRIHDRPTSNVLAWSAVTTSETIADEGAAPEADEPDLKPLGMSPASKRFEKSTVRKTPECASLLTRALQSHSEDDSADNWSPLDSKRRRSLASTISVASTAEHTCDTGLTTPARTSSPSPRLLKGQFAAPAQQPAKVEKKRCISFACAAPPRSTPMPAAKIAVAANPQPVKKPAIRFACDSRPPAATVKPAQQGTPPPAPFKLSTPPTVKKHSSPSANSRPARSVTPKRSSNNGRKPYLTADSKDLQAEGSRFHEFASDEVQDDDWIRQDECNQKRKLTIGDTLQKELAIRKLGKEAEEEAEDEEAEDAAVDDDDDDEDEAADNFEDDEDEDDDDDVNNGQDDDDDVDVEDDGESGYGSEHESSAGYRTDEEIGFAESDDEDDGLVLWWSGTSSGGRTAIASMQQRRTSFAMSVGNLSDSSAFSPGYVPQSTMRIPRSSARVTRRPGTPELPDSTDFVCGTLDEDRPLEEEYMSCIAAKRQEKLRLIPQDIDPSFPTSDPEDDGEDDGFKPHHRLSDEHVWLHGELEDIDHDGDERPDRFKRKVTSPRRMHSPPPKVRGRSPPPRRLFDRQSPRRMRSPPPPRPTASSASPQASPVEGEHQAAFKVLAFRPGLTHTKSLPRAPAIFSRLKTQHQQAQQRKKSSACSHKDRQHVRGAIDIVKGLEQRRQRRREKLQRQQCNRARKGLGQEKRPQPGKGAERMRELGLLMAGKIGPGNYVLSV